jgi:hypothetical protein
MKSRLFSGRALAGFGVACAVALSSPLILQAVVGSPAYAEDEAKPGTVSPEVGKPLQAVQAALKEKKYGEALAKLKEVDAVAKKTPYEEGLIEQFRLIAAIGAEEPAAAAKAYDAQNTAGTLQAPQKIQFAQAIAGAYFKNKDYPSSASWIGKYFAAGGSDLSMRSLLAQAYYLNNDFPNTTKASNEAIDAYEKAGQQAPETLYQLQTSAATKQGDKKAYGAALEKLTAAYPKPEYWADLLHQVASKPGFNDRLSLACRTLPVASPMPASIWNSPSWPSRPACRAKPKPWSKRAIRPMCSARAAKPNAMAACATWPSAPSPPISPVSAMPKPKPASSRTAPAWSIPAWTITAMANTTRPSA